MILCITPNTAVDLTMTLDGLVPAQIHRASDSLSVAGGKGVNVARVCRLLGESAVCGGFLGGATGDYAAALAQREGLAGAWTRLSDGPDRDTRICVLLAHPASGDATVINGQGPRVTADDWARLGEDTARLAPDSAVICISGSLPPGSPIDAFVGLLRSLQRHGHTVWVDTSGEPLRAALGVPGLNIKVNLSELRNAAGRTVDPKHAHDIDQLRRGFDLNRLVVTLGAAGAILTSDAAQLRATPPKIEVVSSVGSGDAMLAGLVVSYARGADDATALRVAVAAGTANALSAGGGSFSLDVFEQVTSNVTIQTA
jgi:1-phosphofructokinase family hexose kinase